MLRPPAKRKEGGLGKGGDSCRLQSQPNLLDPVRSDASLQFGIFSEGTLRLSRGRHDAVTACFRLLSNIGSPR